MSAASAERRCPRALAVVGALRLSKRDRINSALSARTPLAKFPGPMPAAKAISRHRQMSVTSVSLEDCDHVAADDAVVLGEVSERLRQVSERDVAEVVGH